MSRRLPEPKRQRTCSTHRSTQRSSTGRGPTSPRQSATESEATFLKACTWVSIFMLGAGWASYQQSWGLVLVNISLCLFSTLCTDYYRQRWQLQLKREATEHCRRKSVSELEDEQRAARMASVEALLQKNEYRKWTSKTNSSTTSNAPSSSGAWTCSGQSAQETPRNEACGCSKKRSKPPKP